MLSLSSIESYYGKIQALKGISLEVSAGGIVAILGANGAGKSTTLRTIHLRSYSTCSGRDRI
jgi:branched-chain amino acid transport system ATP-binding protein